MRLFENAYSQLRVSFLYKGYNLEFKYGHEEFAKMIVVLLLVSHSLVVLVSYSLYRLTPLTVSIQHRSLTRQFVWRQCAVGFSAVIFALKVVLSYNSPTFSNVYGIQVPTKFAAWLELVFIHMLVPNSSFLGHLCGILAGYWYIKWQPRQLRYTYDSGRAREEYPPDDATLRRRRMNRFAM